MHDKSPGGIMADMFALEQIEGDLAALKQAIWCIRERLYRRVSQPHNDLADILEAATRLLKEDHSQEPDLDEIEKYVWAAKRLAARIAEDLNAAEGQPYGD